MNNSIAVLQITSVGGAMTLAQTLRLANDDTLCHLEVSRCGAWLLGACYSSGRLLVARIHADGALGSVTDTKLHVLHNPDPSLADRQEACHPHQIRLDPRNGRWALVPDLGADMVYVYQFDSSSGALIGADSSERHLHLARGSGPRHLDFHPSGRYVYVSCELDGTVAMCHWDGDSGLLTIGSSFSAMPHGVACSRTHHSGLAHILCASDGRTVYVSSRTDGAIVWFRVDAKGSLQRLGSISCGGICPRHFSIEDNVLLVANQDSNRVDSFEINSLDGSLRHIVDKALVLPETHFPEMVTSGICPPSWC